MTTTSKPHLMVATPCYGGLVTQRYMQCVYNLFRHGQERGIEVSLELLGYESLITRGRNTLLSAFLDHPSATHLMFIDADIGFDATQVQRMLDFDEEVVAGMYPLKLIDWSAAAAARERQGEAAETAHLRYIGVPFEGDERKVRDGFVTGIYAGTGFMMLKRSALEKMIAAYPESYYSAAHSQARLSRNQYALFETMIHPVSREYLSEDYAFCQKWRWIGGEIWLDTQSRLMHTGPHDFLGDTRERYPNLVDTPVEASVATLAPDSTVDQAA
jgi:hypothetical protein